MGKIIIVSSDIDIRWDKKCLIINSAETSVEGCVNVKPAELPALLDRLQEAAEAMQIPTKQGEMVKACESALHALQILSAGKARDAAIEQLQQALASVKR